MAEKKSLTLLDWLLWKPLKFSIITFIMMIGVGFIYAIISSLIFNGATESRSILTILLAITFAISAYLMLKKLPSDNLDRKSFVAINNAQIFFTSAAFIISTLIIVANAEKIMLKLMLMPTHSSMAFIAIIVVAALFYLYLCGLFIANLYVKFRRCRSLGISPWKIICTMPLGFGLLWIPGYILPEKTKNKPILSIKTKWYNKFTDWVLSGSINTIIVFIALVAFSGFFFGFNSILLTLFLAVIFAIWLNIYGKEKFNQSLPKKYATFAIIINIILIICFVAAIVYLSTPQIANINMNISEVSTTLPNN